MNKKKPGPPKQTKPKRPSPGRKQYEENDHIDLVGEVSGNCPKCGAKLVNKRSQKKLKDYELAHIYPLNPTPSELLALRDVPKLSEDPNAPENIIPLCLTCHHKFDNPRTREGYLELFKIKKEIQNQTIARAQWFAHPLTDSITTVIKALTTLSSGSSLNELTYNPHTIEEKTAPEMPHIKRERIKHEVRLFYTHIKSALAMEEIESPGISTNISLQIKSFYSNQKLLNLSKDEIYRSISEWIKLKTNSDSIEACEAITSFFIQNCEIFEAENDNPV